MRVEAVYGVQATDIEEARRFLDETLKAEGEPRENSNRGGDYFLYRGDPNADIYLMTNEEAETGEPLFEEAAEWKVVARIVGGNDDDPWLLAIKGSPERFTPVIYDEFE